MHWDAIAAIGETVGAIAVVATLIYLAVQVRHSKRLLDENRLISMGQVYQARATLRIEGSRAFMDPSWAAIQVKLRGGFDDASMETAARNFENLSEQEKVQVMYYCEAVVQSMDNVLYQQDLGLLDDLDFDAIAHSVTSQYPLWEKSNCCIPRRLVEIAENGGERTKAKA